MLIEFYIGPRDTRIDVNFNRNNNKNTQQNFHIFFCKKIYQKYIFHFLFSLVQVLVYGINLTHVFFFYFWWPLQELYYQRRLIFFRVATGNDIPMSYKNFPLKIPEIILQMYVFNT